MADYTLEDVVDRPAEVPFLVSFGGGVNSAALLVGLQQIGIRPDLITFADTGGEKPETYDFIRAVEGWCSRVGFPPLTIVRTVPIRSTDQNLEDCCRRLEIMPSRTVGLGTCALRWKIEPQTKFLRKWAPFQVSHAAGYKPFRALGYDAGEGRRAKIPEDDLFRYVFPLIEWEWDREECLTACESAGLGRPMKSACFYCPSSRKSEVLWLAKAHPDLFQRAVEMERAALKSGKMHSVKGLGRHWSWEELVKASEAERQRYQEAPVEACTVCNDGSCEIDD